MSDTQQKIVAGELKNFDTAKEHLKKWVSFLVEADEAETALNTLKNLPGFYREHYPKDLLELRRTILKQFMTQKDYIENDIETELMSEERSVQILEHTHRAQAVLKKVKEYNERGLKPHLIDLGPGEYWLPMALKKKECKFTYQGIGLQNKAEAQAKAILKDYLFTFKEPIQRPVIFCAMEIIEHLWNPYEVEMHLAKLPEKPDYMFISTPLYTFGQGNDTWTKPEDCGKLGHIKTYTPTDLVQYCLKSFPDYSWEIKLHICMLAEGSLKQ